MLYLSLVISALRNIIVYKFLLCDVCRLSVCLSVCLSVSLSLFLSLRLRPSASVLLEGNVLCVLCVLEAAITLAAFE